MDNISVPQSVSYMAFAEESAGNLIQILCEVGKD